MTVKELKKLLENHPNDKKVMVLIKDNGLDIHNTRLFELVRNVVYLEAG